MSFVDGFLFGLGVGAAWAALIVVGAVAVVIVAHLLPDKWSKVP